MRVPGRRRSRRELDDRLNYLASGNAQVVPLEIDAPGSHLLRLRPVERQAGCGDQRRDCHESSRLHVDLRVSRAGHGSIPAGELVVARVSVRSSLVRVSALHLRCRWRGVSQTVSANPLAIDRP